MAAAVEHVRTLTSVGLEAAKDYVDTLANPNINSHIKTLCCQGRERLDERWVSITFDGCQSIIPSREEATK